MKLLFASQNEHKAAEVREIIGDEIGIISLHDLDFTDELPETHYTLEENALEKAAFVFQKFNQDCFSEDTALEIDALNGEPGVYSARYAGRAKNAKDNIGLVLKKMTGVSNRSARFRTVVCLMLKGKSYFFEGVVKGKILNYESGTTGFGYDPIFVPDGFTKTFAEMSISEKNQISHRRQAVIRMRDFLSYWHES